MAVLFRIGHSLCLFRLLLFPFFLPFHRFRLIQVGFIRVFRFEFTDLRVGHRRDDAVRDKLQQRQPQDVDKPAQDGWDCQDSAKQYLHHRIPRHEDHDRERVRSRNDQ